MGRRVGDAIGAGVLVLVLVYLGLVGAHFSGGLNLTAFGTHWDADGFCVAHRGTLFDSHLLCLYTDTVWALLFLRLAKSEHRRPEIAGPLKEAAPSVFMHGLAHGLLWYQATYFGGLGETAFIHTFSNLPEKATAVLVVTAFFYAFVHNQLSSSKLLSLLQASLHCVATVALCPPKFIFTYVNTVIFFNTTGSRMLGLKGPKDVFSDMEHGVGAFVLLFTWLEPLTCDAFLIDWGGHAWFDNSITVGTFAFYLAARVLPPRKGSEGSKAS